MSTLHYENWDGVTAPSIPSGWTIQSGSGIVTASSGAAPISSPNMIELPATATATDYAITWGTEDNVSGNVTVQGTGLFVGQISTVAFSVFGRASSSSAPFSGNCYEAQIQGNSGLSGILYLNKWISGVSTNLSTVSISAISYDQWYQISLILNGSSHNVQVQRLTDGYYLTYTGSWNSTSQYAISEGDTAISGSGYSGWSAVTGGTAAVYGDDWYLIGLSAPAIPPNKPVVVAIPYQFYPAWAE